MGMRDTEGPCVTEGNSKKTYNIPGVVPAAVQHFKNSVIIYWAELSSTSAVNWEHFCFGYTRGKGGDGDGEGLEEGEGEEWKERKKKKKKIMMADRDCGFANIILPKF